jgi:hypothetical protein
VLNQFLISFMARTPQASVRFDPQKLELIKTREGLTTFQKVVDYLVDAYWWQNKLNPTNKNGQPATEYQAFEGQIKDASEVQVLELIKWSVIKSKSLSQFDKRILMETISEKIKAVTK